jgi:hypothetical protein
VRLTESFQGAFPVEAACAAEAALEVRRSAVLFRCDHEIDPASEAQNIPENGWG